MSETPEIAAAKRRLEDHATELPNWARQLLDYIAKLERERDGLTDAYQNMRAWAEAKGVDTVTRG